MRIPAVVSKNEIRRDYLLQLFENGLHVGTHKWHESIGEFLEQGALQPLGADERFNPALCLSFADSDGAEHHPVKCAARVLLDQLEDCATTANLDVVGMRAQT